MGTFLIDTNIFIKYLAGDLPEPALSLISAIIDKQPIISVVTRIELLSWVSVDKRQERYISLLVNASDTLMIDSTIVSVCIRLKRSRKIKLPDALIAATAIANGYTLVSADNDFKKIEGLSVVNPYEIAH